MHLYISIQINPTQQFTKSAVAPRTTLGPALFEEDPEPEDTTVASTVDAASLRSSWLGVRRWDTGQTAASHAEPPGEIRLNPVTILFVCIYLSLLVVQFLAMLVHRLTTFAHLLAATDMPTAESVVRRSLKRSRRWSESGGYVTTTDIITMPSAIRMRPNPALRSVLSAPPPRVTKHVV